jgi:putative redox protein
LASSGKQNNNIMEIQIELRNDAFHLLATNDTENAITFDASADLPGAGNHGMRPMQALLASMGGCTSIDVLLILRKRRLQIDHFALRLTATREAVEQANVLSKIHLHFTYSGTPAPAVVEKAAQLSLQSYCSVALSLHPRVKYEIEVSQLPAAPGASLA